MDSEVLPRMLAQYGLADAQFISVQKGYRNRSHHIIAGDGRHLNLIIYKDEPGIAARIRRTNAVGDHLAAAGIPARHTADPRILQASSPNGKRYAALYHYLPGVTIPWEAYTRRHIKLLGQTMSDMHAALQSLRQPPHTTVANEYVTILRRVDRYCQDISMCQAMQTKLHIAVRTSALTRMRQVLHIAAQLPGQQALHMDFVRGNILFDDAKDELRISGVLDFEKTAWGHPVFDVARTLAFLLVDCKYTPAESVRKYFLQSGYNKRGQMRFTNITIYNVLENDISLLDSLVDMFLFYDFYKFLRHNPYEFLYQNEHYMRTKQILINRNIIHEA